MQDTVNTTTGADEDYQTLSHLNSEYVHAVEECDVQWFESHLAPDFMNSNPDGSIVARDGFLAQIATGSGLSRIEAHDVIVRVLGEFAIIHARTTFNTPSGEVGAGRYTDIWSMRAGRWLCVAAQVTRC